MFGIDGQVGHFPVVIDVTYCVHALLDRVLVRTRKSRVDQFTHVRVTGVNWQTIGVLGDVTNLVNISNVKFGVDALREEVESESNDVHVSGSLPVPEEGSLDAVGPGEDPQLGRRDRRSAIVVRMQRQHDGVAAINVVREPFNRVGVEVR